jgi:hypothetical protein
MKKTIYNGIEMTISHTSSYGRYRLSALINGERITAETTDSEIYDYFDCDYYDSEDTDFARRAAYNIITAQLI